MRALEGARTELKLRMVGLDDIMIGTHGQEDTEQDDEDQGNENLQRGVPDTIVQVPLKQHDGGTERDSDQDEGSDSFCSNDVLVDFGRRRPGRGQ